MPLLAPPLMMIMMMMTMTTTMMMMMITMTTVTSMMMMMMMILLMKCHCLNVPDATKISNINRGLNGMLHRICPGSLYAKYCPKVFSRLNVRYVTKFITINVI